MSEQGTAGLDVFSLAGRTALVTGGGGGIGASLAEALAGAGAHIAVVGRTAEALDAAVQRVKGIGG